MENQTEYTVQKSTARLIANQEQEAPLLPSIKLVLDRQDWTQLTALVLKETVNAQNIGDKYMKAILHPLLKQIYVKLHNKLHSLKGERNNLSLSLPEASVLNSALLELNTTNYLVISIINTIDQKLT